MTIRTLGVITARGGSKGVSRKNIKLLCGKPLLHYTAEAGLASDRITTVMLSTDDEEIAEEGRKAGVEVPFMRPAELALDTTPTLPVIQHALKWYADKGQHFDLVCLLQPTNPLRKAADIDACIDLLINKKFDSVLSVRPVPHEFNPHWVFFRDDEDLLRISTGDEKLITRRQDLPPAYCRDGVIYVMRSRIVMKQNTMYGKRIGAYNTNAQYEINIDTMNDWEEAERIMNIINQTKRDYEDFSKNFTQAR
ncbi:MAG: acylneuraminate cytidylyltransferase family protein [Bacteroidota bacterium]|nr:acylneuraminate cytidylyltransferase family protein [Bacteroidota bacterium]